MLWAWLPRGLISFVAQMAVRDLRGTRPAVALVAAAVALKRALDTEAAAARRQALSAQVMSYDRLELSLWNALPGNVGVSMQAG